jgi:hypothetical protein
MASLCFGISGPVAKLAFNKGLTGEGYTLEYATCLGVIALVSIYIRDMVSVESCFPGTTHFVWWIIGAITGAVTFIVLAHVREAGIIGMKTCFANSEATIIGILAAVVCAIGFLASSFALAHPDSKVSIIIAILATYPVVSTVVGLTFFGEADHVNLKMLLSGVVLTITGSVLVSNSLKTIRP